MLTVSFVLLVLVTFVSLAALGCHLALSLVLRTLAAVSPGLRAHLLLLFAAAPWLIGTSVLVSSIGDILFGACDLGSACLWNENPTEVEPLRALIAVPLLLATFAGAFQVMRHLIASRRVVATLDGASIAGEESPIRLVPGSAALALAGRGRVYISQAIREHLPPDQYRAVVLHEQAHLQRRDGYFQMVARLLASAYLPPWRNRLLDALTLANEQSCDERAAAAVGREATAAAILAVERMRGSPAAALLPGFADGFVAARVGRLLNPERPDWNIGLLRTLVVLGVVFAFLGADVLYYLTMLILYPVAL